MPTHLFFLAILVLAAPVHAGQTAQPLIDADITAILTNRIDRDRQAVGMVVGVVTPAGRRIVSHGTATAGGARMTAETIFEIGSVTKVLTAWLLADMHRRGELSIEDSLDRFLMPVERPSIASNGTRQITLADLATHTAGLPFWPPNLATSGDNYADLASYSQADLMRFLSSYEVPASIGSRWAYSNIDFGLLGLLLGRHKGTSFEALLHDRVAEPLMMKDTVFAATSTMTSRLATGHDAQLRPARPWSVPTFAAGGSLSSTTSDLLSFVEALLDPKSPAGSALSIMLATKRPGPGFQQALGWMVFDDAGSPLLVHDGQTLGFSSAVAVDPRARTAVVVLSNAATGVGDIARHVIRPAIPLASPQTPAPSKTEISFDSRLFDRYAGKYEPKPGLAFTVSHEGDALMLQIPGLPKLRLRPESATDFFVAENTRLSVTFAIDASGQVMRLVFRAPGAEIPAARASQ